MFYLCSCLMFRLEAIMSQNWFRSYRLATSEDDVLHPRLKANGAFFGNSLALLEQDEIGQLRPRPRDQLESLLSVGYAIPVDLSRRMQSLETVARALNDNNRCLAAIALVQAQFPPLPDAFAAGRMIEADNLAKGGLAYLTQPRVQAGALGAGQWTSGAADATSSLAARSLRWLTALSGRISAPVAIATGVLFPDNENLESSGSVPGQHGLNYRFSEMRLTLIQIDGEGGARLLFSGMPDKDGLYLDQEGTIVGRAVGNGFMLDNAGIAAINALQAAGVASAESASATDVGSDQPKLCPDAVPDRPNGMKERAAAYQQFITGLPRGMGVELNGVMFDGCRTTDGTMLEAKGPGYQWALEEDGEFFPNYKGKQDLYDQIERQVAAAGERQVEWHFAEEAVATAIGSYVAKRGHKNITVIYTPTVSE
jgi:hypothetical protein